MNWGGGGGSPFCKNDITICKTHKAISSGEIKYCLKKYFTLYTIVRTEIQ